MAGHSPDCAVYFISKVFTMHPVPILISYQPNYSDGDVHAVNEVSSFLWTVRLAKNFCSITA